MFSSGVGVDIVKYGLAILGPLGSQTARHWGGTGVSPRAMANGNKLNGEEIPQAATGLAEDDTSIYDEISSTFIDEIFHARCQDLSVMASPDAFRRFASVLKRKVTSTTFDLAQNGIGIGSAACIGKWLAADDLFIRLNLARNAIGNIGVKHIADLIRVNPFLISLDLRSNDITASGFAALSAALCVNQSITHLDLSSDLGFNKNTLGERGAAALASALASTTCRITALHLGNVGASGLAILSERGLSQNTTIELLDLRLNHIGDDAITAIVSPLPSRPTLITVNLSRNQLTDMATPAVLALLRSPTLRTLDLSYNGFGRVFATAFRTALESNDIHLETINIDGNTRLGLQKGHVPIIEGLLTNRSVQHLFMSRCSVKDSAMLAQLLRQNSTLQRLGLAMNSFDDGDGIGLVGALSQNTTLISLDLNDNSLGDGTGAALATALSTNTTLQELHLKDNDLTDITATKLLIAIRESGSTLSKLSLQLNGISMRIWLELEHVLRDNRAHLRTNQIAAFHDEVMALQIKERDLRQKIADLDGELQRRTPEAIREEVRTALETLQDYKDGEERETEELKEQIEARSRVCREQIRQYQAKCDAVESEYRQTYRAFVTDSHKLDLKVGSEQRKKGTTFRALRKLQKQFHEQGEIARDRTLLQNALTRQLADEKEAARWVQEATSKWSARIDKLTSQVTDEYLKGIQTYLETLVPAPVKTTRVKQRWDRVKEKRQQLLLEFNADAFLRWFLDPLRPMPNRKEAWRHHNHQNNDPNAGYSLHAKVVTSPSMIDNGNAKLIHSSHSVYSMSLHGMGQLSTVLIALADPALALEFRTFRSDVAHVVIRSPGHVKMDEFKKMIAEKIGVDEEDITALYHTVSTSVRVVPRHPRHRPRPITAQGAPADQTSSSTDHTDISSEEDAQYSENESPDAVSNAEEAPSGPVPRRRKRKKLKKWVEKSVKPTAKKAVEKSAASSALREVQELFPEPESDSEPGGADDDSDDGIPIRDDGDTRPAPLPSQHDREKMERRKSDSSAIVVRVRQRVDHDDPVAIGKPRRSSVPHVLLQGTNRRRHTDLMSWSYHHTPNIDRHPIDHPPFKTSITAVVPITDFAQQIDPESRLRAELMSTESALGPMHPAVSTTLSFMGQYYTQNRLYDEAEAAYLRALQIREKAFGRRHPHVATILHSLAMMYAEQPDRLAMAEAFLVRAIAVREKTLGRQNPIVADSLTSLGRLYERLGQQMDKAEPLFTRSLMIRERIYGKRHALVIESLQDLARVYAYRKQLDPPPPVSTDMAPSQANQSHHRLSRTSTTPTINVAIVNDPNPAYKLDDDGDTGEGQFRNKLKPSFRPVAMRNEMGIDRKPLEVGSVAFSANTEDLDFSDAVQSVTSPWITRRRLLNVKPWSKLVSGQGKEFSLPRVQINGGGPLSLSLNSINFAR